ncbi:MAG: 2-amino-4-hydroxy-6-hydroxymethyldihydropteridine diphosphokinase [Blastocatellia bacterium]|nr:2-amino-4-hydroxy-6-hydroxymethyldihydropteridine diphosphokinase [Blastocatellia bacterium]
MQIWYLGLGSNLGDRLTLLTAAIKRLIEGSQNWRVSSFYETEPMDYLDQPWFLNAVLEVQFAQPRNPYEFLRTCLELEAEFGRVRTVPRGARTLDVDILLGSTGGTPLVLDEMQNGLHLTVPHPRLHLRRFVLEPLCELCPEDAHPVSGKSFGTFLQELGTHDAVHRLNEVFSLRE